MKTDDFGNRMKAYEAIETRRTFIPLLPIYARLDGRSFHSFTNGLARPYDVNITQAMLHTAKYLVEHTQARIAYTQSDEISLVWLQDFFDSELLFARRIQKLNSTLAAIATAAFNHFCFVNPTLKSRAALMPPTFDCRTFQLPNKTEAANAFLWREQDATKNAISMAARSFYPHKTLLGKTGPEMQELIFQKGQNFNDYPPFFKRGTFLRKITVERPFTPEELAAIPEKYRPPTTTLVKRSKIVELDMPPFARVLNREAVIFDKATPITPLPDTNTTSTAPTTATTTATIDYPPPPATGPAPANLD